MIKITRILFYILFFSSFVCAEQSLQFITFKSGSWVLAEKPNNVELTICQLSTRKFKCKASEKIKHAKELKVLEKELIFASKLLD